ncbi:DUF5685 family protein [Nonomuraea sp. NPDC050328]|uniref:DUF5685 family protein n=1 Tax=Nonomuraea sp. NPDC050328 TaxID=3364361 RepID=UPI0037A51C85
MFGIVRPCRHRLCGNLHREWMSHLCGLCLTLRDEHGHLSRLVTNYDGLLISVLVEAQRPEVSPRRRAMACALRGFKGADVLSAHDEGARLAAAVSLVLAAAKARDHAADGDGRRLVTASAARMATRWDAAGARGGSAVGFDTSVLTDAVARQAALEADPTRGLLELTEPTETAVAAAFAHTAVLAGKPHNAAALGDIGRFFGRIVHLVDAAEDLAEDRRRGAFNPLLATGTGLAEARRLCEDACYGIEVAFAELDLVRPALARTLLVREVARAATHAMDGAAGIRHVASAKQEQDPNKQQSSHCDGICDCCQCCDCCKCCGDSDGDGCCNGCDCGCN